MDKTNDEVLVDAPLEESTEVEQTETKEESESQDSQLTTLIGSLKRQNKQLQKQLDEKEKAPKVEEPKTELQTETPTGLSRDEAILFAQGLSEEEVQYADKISKIDGVSLTEAVKTSIFKSWKTENEKAAKAQEASLGSSKGSGVKKAEKSFTTPGLSDDDHKALFQKKVLGK